VPLAVKSGDGYLISRNFSDRLLGEKASRIPRVEASGATGDPSVGARENVSPYEPCSSLRNVVLRGEIFKRTKAR